MIFRLFDVDHGFCAAAESRNGTRLLFDCGHHSDKGFRPSAFLASIGWSRLDHLVISHPDEDHVSDLPLLRATLPIGCLWMNPDFSPTWIALDKMLSGGSGPGVDAVIEMRSAYRHPVSLRTDGSGDPEFAIRFFANDAGAGASCNDLSLVTFLSFGPVRICLPGDLEAKGWRSLLANPDFRASLAGVNVFIASHHGRESGYDSHVFDYCRPKLVLLSDCSIKYESQIVDYARHASGVLIDGKLRRVLTTRCDGDILITHQPGDATAWVRIVN